MQNVSAGGCRPEPTADQAVEENGIAVGLTRYHVAHDGGEGGGIDLVLIPDVRGRKLGSSVVHALVGYLRRERGWRGITVDPDVSNLRGVNFWRSVGFRNEQLVESDLRRQPYRLMEWPTSGYVVG